jgi:cell division protein FtsL
MNEMGGIEARNYGVKRKTDRKGLAELLRRLVFLSAIAAILSLYVYMHTRIIHCGYQIQELATEEQALMRTQVNLILEEQTLKDPERIDAIARKELGMAPIRVSQLISPPAKAFDLKASNTLAWVNSADSQKQAKSPLTN